MASENWSEKDHPGSDPFLIREKKLCDPKQEENEICIYF